MVVFYNLRFLLQVALPLERLFPFVQLLLVFFQGPTIKLGMNLFL